MSIVPRSSSEFRDPIFWRRFYKNCGKEPFEWYGGWDQLGVTLEKYIKLGDRILQIGCGNSRLAEQLYDNGYRHVKSIDTDRNVISRHAAQNKNKRPELEFEQCCAAQLKEPVESCNVVLDKGTVDALLPPNPDDFALNFLFKIFSEVARVLSNGGRFIVVTLAQHHVVKAFVTAFTSRSRFMIRAQKIESKEDGFFMPVFLLVATKLRLPIPNPIIDYTQSIVAKSERVTSSESLFSLICAEQELAYFIHVCKKKLEEEASLNVFDAKGEKRYMLTIVDDPAAIKITSYAVFIIPLGRDNDWICATEKGRCSLRTKCKKSRLVIAFMFPNQKYAGMEQVKEELNPFVKAVAPSTLCGSIEYLSFGDVDVKRSLASGSSPVSGDWVVEEVEIGQEIYRRLRFLSSTSLVQSEARLMRKKKKNFVDLNTLTCEHHVIMLSAFSFVDVSNNFVTLRNAYLRLAVLGLGGGLLTTFLHRIFSNSSIVAVELDPDVVQIARQWFCLPPDNARLSVIVQDAVIFVKEFAKAGGEKFDIIFIDVAGPADAGGLNCPPPSFIESSVISDMWKCLSDNGVLALNLATRDESISNLVKKKFQMIFPKIYVKSSGEDVNEVLICVKNKSDVVNPKQFVSGLQIEAEWQANMCSNLESLKLVD